MPPLIILFIFPFFIYPPPPPPPPPFGSFYSFFLSSLVLLVSFSFIHYSLLLWIFSFPILSSFSSFFFVLFSFPISYFFAFFPPVEIGGKGGEKKGERWKQKEGNKECSCWNPTWGLQMISKLFLF